MKSSGAVRHKLTQVRFRHLKKKLEAGLRPTPENCKFNARGLENSFNFCLYGAGNPETWVATLCDVQVDGGARARSCTLFCPRRDKDQIKDEFNKDLGEMGFPEIASQYPDMAALIWVLDDEDIQEVQLPSPVYQDGLDDRTWWQRLLTGAAR